MWQFGILVTTSYLSQQAYQELTNDRHSVIVISASYVAEILVNAGLGTPEAVKQWLIAQFPPLVKKEAKPMLSTIFRSRSVVSTIMLVGLTLSTVSAQVMPKAQVANLIVKVENGVDEFRKYLERRGENARDGGRDA